MGTALGVRTRRYHGWVHAARGRRFLVLGALELWLEAPGRAPLALSTHAYQGGVRHPDGATRLVGFTHEPWPMWRFAGGETVELCLLGGLLALRVRSAAPAGSVLVVRPLLAGRDLHALQHENPVADRAVRDDGAGGQRVQLYPDVPALRVRTSGVLDAAPDWYRAFELVAERERGQDDREDLASVGAWRVPLEGGAAHVLFAAGDTPWPAAGADVDALLAAEATRRQARGAARAADAYVVRMDGRHTVIAGYPWFGDWGRDTFLALRGLCLHSGRTADAGEILAAWAPLLRDGLLPNRFPDGASRPEYTSVDAALWYVVAAEAWRRAAGDAAPPAVVERVIATCDEIVEAYRRGTRHGIGMTDDGLLAAGVPGLQLTWMDAKLGDWVVTPRIGKPVELQALWIRALEAVLPHEPALAPLLLRARESVAARFWDEARGALFDVVDADHVAGRVDAALRPNQLLALGGLGPSLLPATQTVRALATIEAALWTPMGPRSLAPDDPAYVGRYQGDLRARDAAYHQGTVWPYWVGAFVEAWLRRHGDTAAARAAARVRFVAPLVARGGELGLGHLPELADGDAPHAARGCPFQAWSVAEATRALAMTAPDAPPLP